MKKQELSDFPFPAFVENSQIPNYQLKNRLPLELFLKHQGYEFNFKEKSYITKIDGEVTDILILEISTLLGTPAIGAKHFYGNLILPEVDFLDIQTQRIVGGGELPSMLKKIELHRRLTKKDILRDPKYEGLEVGMWAEGFNSVEEVIACGKIVAKEYFPGFKLSISQSSINELKGIPAWYKRLIARGD